MLRKNNLNAYTNSGFKESAKNLRKIAENHVLQEDGYLTKIPTWYVLIWSEMVAGERGENNIILLPGAGGFLFKKDNDKA